MQAKAAPELLVRVWRQLSRGELRVGCSYSTSQHHYLDLHPELSAAPPNGADLEILERWALGESQKSIACDLGCSISRVAECSKRCMSQLGMIGCASSIPMSVVMMVRASRDRVLAGIDYSLATSDVGTHVMVATRMDGNVWPLSPSEHSVIRARVDGKSHAEIATLRGVSLRTVANQIAAAYNKLHVSGRVALLNHLLERASASGSASVVSAA